LVVIANLTRKGRSHAVIENVVTDPAFRKRGYASRILSKAKNLAMEDNCYKIMLMTGSQDPGVWRFYEKAGYNSEDKKPFVQWIGASISQ
jgi:ribosomal protein S18 acetylase RimI-like enzyme